MVTFEMLKEQGYQRLGPLLTEAQCRHLRSLYDNGGHFRSRIDMARYRFGRGEYQYFAYPLPPLVDRLRTSLYRDLAPIARQWMENLQIPADYPDELVRFLHLCHSGGQQRPTPLLLRYREGDYNALHQDLYGRIFFPFQVICCLSQPQTEFTGGELLLVEQQPRAQSIGRVVRLEQGEAVVITTRYRPARGNRGFYRANYRHGVSPVESGERFSASFSTMRNKRLGAGRGRHRPGLGRGVYCFVWSRRGVGNAEFTCLPCVRHLANSRTSFPAVLCLPAGAH